MLLRIAIGLEDFTADLGVQRTAEGIESFYARTRLVVAAKAAGIQPIDSVFSDVGDMEALEQNVLKSKALGFEGMGCIHPRQIHIIKQGFAPDQDEIEKSRKIVIAFEEAKKRSGCCGTWNKNDRCSCCCRGHRKTIDLAVRLGLLTANWRERFSTAYSGRIMNQFIINIWLSKL